MGGKPECSAAVKGRSVLLSLGRCSRRARAREKEICFHAAPRARAHAFPSFVRSGNRCLVLTCGNVRREGRRGSRSSIILFRSASSATVTSPSSSSSFQRPWPKLTWMGTAKVEGRGKAEGRPVVGRVLIESSFACDRRGREGGGLIRLLHVLGSSRSWKLRSSQKLFWSSQSSKCFLLSAKFSRCRNSATRRRRDSESSPARQSLKHEPACPRPNARPARL